MPCWLASDASLSLALERFVIHLGAYWRVQRLAALCFSRTAKTFTRPGPFGEKLKSRGIATKRLLSNQSLQIAPAAAQQ